MERIQVVLFSPTQAHGVLSSVWASIKAFLMAGHRVVLEVREETRSDAQNRLLHSRFNDIAKQIEWCGCKREPEVWKRLLTAAWLRARGEGVELLPAIDGHGVDVVFRHTSKLTRSESSELSEFVMAWGTERGVNWCPASLGRGWIDPETGEIT